MLRYRRGIFQIQSIINTPLGRQKDLEALHHRQSFCEESLGPLTAAGRDRETHIRLLEQCLPDQARHIVLDFIRHNLREFKAMRRKK